jgi:hypothetical protein
MEKSALFWGWCTKASRGYALEVEGAQGVSLYQQRMQAEGGGSGGEDYY